MSACRDALYHCGGALAHPGLVLASYLRKGDEADSRHDLLQAACAAAARTRKLYESAYHRWQPPAPSAETVLKVRGRLITGLGQDTVLETGLRLHHTYGVPILPGSGLKGLASHYCHTVWGTAQPEFRSQEPDHEPGRIHQALFGTTDDSGHIVFHDAWITPETLAGALVPDVMTPHHTRYYMDKDKPAPTDFDDPVPVTFLSVRGQFRVAVTCDVEEKEIGQKWADLALKLLTEALTHWGAGGKTSSGYGKMEAVPAPE